jgi:LacI family transcriptional regulator
MRKLINNSGVTLKDVAMKSGFAINTVSRALRDKEDISDETKRVIQSIAKEMGYISNTIAGSLRSGNTKTIAIILGDISNPHFGIMVKEVELIARKHYYNTFVINTDENYTVEEQSIYSALGKKVDGIILCPSQYDNKDIQLLKKIQIPFVLWGRHFEDEDSDYVICDDIKGGYLATQHLIEKGHKKILFLNGPGYISSAKERLAGYKKALAEKNIPFSKELVREVSVICGETQKTLTEVIDEGIEFSAIFAFSDMIAWEVIYALQKRKIGVPDDIGVIGFDNIQSRLFFPFPLTTISPSKGKMARKAMNILLKRMNGQANDSFNHEIIEPSLVIRQST